MINRNKLLWKHFRKSATWLAGASVFGLAPLLFLQFINVMSGENLSGREIGQLIRDGIILFVSCAITGSVVLDCILSKFRVKGWLGFIAIYISPFIMLTYLFLKYLQLYVQFDDQHEFGPGSITIEATIAFSVIYCLLVKAFYYMREEAGT